MSVSVTIPDELYSKAKEIAESRHSSVDEVIASGFAEHVATWERLRQRAANGNREAFLRVMDKSPDIEPPGYDRIDL